MPVDPTAAVALGAAIRTTTSSLGWIVPIERPGLVLGIEKPLPVTMYCVA